MQLLKSSKAATNRGLAKVAVQCSADTFVVNQSLVLRIPNDIKEGEIVMVDDLIENFLGYHYNQGGSERLKSCKAIWKNNDLQIQYKPDVDCIRAVG